MTSSKELGGCSFVKSDRVFRSSRNLNLLGKFGRVEQVLIPGPNRNDALKIAVGDGCSFILIGYQLSCLDLSMKSALLEGPTCVSVNVGLGSVDHNPTSG